MEHNHREEEKITARQSLVLIAGFALIIFWVRLPYPHYTHPTLLQNSMDQLFIPKLSLAVPIVYADSPDEEHIQFLLRSSVVHLPGTVNPGQTGNCYIVGHSSDYLTSPGDYKTIFSRLPELVAGDEIQIATPSGIFIYEVQKTRVVEPSDLSVLSQDTAGRKLLTLQTSYPVGSAKQRFIVVAEHKKK